MPSLKLTARDVTRLQQPPQGRDAFYWDTALAGFGVRVRGSGFRSYVVQYRVGTKQRRVNLGRIEELSLAEAREKAKAILSGATLGEDERAKIEQRRQAASAPAEETLGSALDRYLEHKAKDWRPSTRSVMETYLRKDTKPLHGRALRSVAKRDIAALLDDIAERRGGVSANRARTALSGFFAWAIGRDLCDVNPIVGTEKAVKEQPRDRVLADDELADVWVCTSRPHDFDHIVRLLILTGQRRDEVGGMRWSELDLDRGVWTIPRERSKNDRPHEVPLSAPALAILRSRQRDDGRDLVFGRRGGGFSGWSRSRGRLHEAIAKHRRDRAEPGKRGKPLSAKDAERFALPAFTLHDLRRTAVTGMAELGVSPNVIEAVVNHQSGHKAGVAGVYNRAEYREEKRAALARWATHVLALAGEAVDAEGDEAERAAGNVVPFAAAK